MTHDAPKGMAQAGIGKRIAAIGAVTLFGAAVGYGVGALARGESAVSGADATALVLASAMAGQGAVQLAISLRGRRRGRSIMRLQAIALALSAAMLATPPAAAAFAGDAPRGLAQALMAGLVAGLVGLSAVNIAIWRQADEFLRKLIVETAAASFWLLQALLFVQAAGERLGLLGPVSAWSGVVVLMSVYLIASLLISVRAGASGPE